ACNEIQGTVHIRTQADFLVELPGSFRRTVQRDEPAGTAELWIAVFVILTDECRSKRGNGIFQKVRYRIETIEILRGIQKVVAIGGLCMERQIGRQVVIDIELVGVVLRAID